MNAIGESAKEYVTDSASGIPEDSRRRLLVVDAFLFAGELDLLELRLRELEEVVDWFVLVESRRSFVDRPKPLHFEEHRARFRRWESRVRQVVLDDWPEGVDGVWERENFQRNALGRGLSGFPPETLVMVSDVDEIPRAAAVARLRPCPPQGPVVLEVQGFNLALNYRAVLPHPHAWQYGPVVTPLGEFTTAQAARDLRLIVPRRDPDKVLRNAGWHFSFLGEETEILAKLDDWAHQEENTGRNRDAARRRRLVAAGRGVTGAADFIFHWVAVDGSFPRPLQEDRAGHWRHRLGSPDTTRREAGNKVLPYAPAHARLPEWLLHNTPDETAAFLPSLAPLLYDLLVQFSPRRIRGEESTGWVADLVRRAAAENQLEPVLTLRPDAAPAHWDFAWLPEQEAVGLLPGLLNEADTTQALICLEGVPPEGTESFLTEAGFSPVLTFGLHLGLTVLQRGNRLRAGDWTEREDYYFAVGALRRGAVQEAALWRENDRLRGKLETEKAKHLARRKPPTAVSSSPNQPEAAPKTRPWWRRWSR